MAIRIRCVFIPIQTMGAAVMVGAFAQRLQEALDKLPEDSRRLERIRIEPLPPFGQYLLWEEEGEVPEPSQERRVFPVN